MPHSRTWIPLIWAMGLLPVVLLAAPQSARQFTEYAPDVSRRLVEGSYWSEVSTPLSHQRTLRRVSINGHLVPHESVSQ